MLALSAASDTLPITDFAAIGDECNNLAGAAIRFQEFGVRRNMVASYL